MKLSAEGICAIIKSCAESGVAYFNLGDLQISFKGATVLEAPDLQPNWNTAAPVDNIEKDELALREEQLAQMEIENPLAYERALMTGDLINSKVGENSDEEDR